MAYILLYIALTWLALMPARFRAMAKGYRKTSLALKALPTALAAAFAAAGCLGTEGRGPLRPDGLHRPVYMHAGGYRAGRAL